MAEKGLGMSFTENLRHEWALQTPDYLQSRRLQLEEVPWIYVNLLSRQLVLS
jgi:hypothetical protein